MSQKLVSRNGDLSRLRAAGYDVRVAKSGHLLVRDVPYVCPGKVVRRGTIACDLDVAGEATVPPQSHVVFFVGEPPCDEHGNPLPGVSENTNQALGEGLTPNHQISRKPTTGPTPGQYPDYFEKLSSYLAILTGPAQAIDPTATAATHPVAIPEDGESVFHYLDTAATKAGLVTANGRLEGSTVAIVGVGGTGSYVLDLVTKTPVAEIHLFDGDLFLNHNAFRCPGAASLDDLAKKQFKVDYLAAAYSRMRKNVVPHPCFVDATTVNQLRDMGFVFVCIDRGAAKRLVVERLEEWGVSFIDVGMGVQLGDDNTLAGIVTVTSSTPRKRDHLRSRVAFGDGEAANEYSRNVQIADLSAINAALAVVKWKKLRGYYHDTADEHFCAYTVRSNQLISEDAYVA